MVLALRSIRYTYCSGRAAHSAVHYIAQFWYSVREISPSVIMEHALQDFLYQIPPPERSRLLGTKMEIIAVGLPRSGTDSLRTALLMLGYQGVWHGFDFPLKRPEDGVLWVPLLRAAAKGNRNPARNFDWDRLLGDCDGVMDMPPCMFTEELLDFYPDAKIIFNRRADMRAWHRSLNEAADTVMGSRLFWLLSWFDAELRWWYQSAFLCLSIMGSGPGGFKGNGLEWGLKYYERLEAKLQREGREYLRWDVKDGWASLCKFLQKDQPDEEFPWTNRSGDEFKQKSENAVKQMVKRSMARLVVLITAFVVAGAVLYRLSSDQRSC
jgi:hypothetical protein